jgi:tetratricopeptide (TPR) repeat protein
MKYPFILGCTAAIICFADVVVAQTTTKIESLAKSVTVEVSVGNGSGVLVYRQGNLYTIVTNRHVVCGSSNCDESRLAATYPLRTPDGQVYTVPKAGVKLLRDATGNSLDLAIIQFRSNRRYPVAQIADQDSLKVDDALYSAGFSKNRGFQVGSGKAIAVVNKRLPDDKGGYTVIYDANNPSGMNGGGVFDRNGRLVAIHGENIEVISPTSIRTDRTEVDSKIGYHRAIPVRWVLQGLGTQGIVIGNNSLRTGNGANNLATADEYFIAGLNKFVQPGADFQAGQRQAAILLSQAIQLNPRYTTAYFIRAIVYDRNQSYTQAVTDYNTAISLNPKFVPAYNNRGILYQKLNDPRRALADFNQALALDSKNADTYFNRGFLKYQKLNDFKGALADYNQAISIDPKLTSAYINRGVLKKNQLSDPQGALTDYNQAITLNPGLAIAYGARGLLKYQKLNDFKGALADYNQAIFINPKFAETYFNRGLLKYQKLNDFRSALADYNQAIFINPKFAEAYGARGLLRYEKLNDRPRGIADVRQAAKIAQAQGNTQLLQTTKQILKSWGLNG